MTGKDLRGDGIILNLDKPRCFALSMNAICDLEDKYGSLEEAIDAVHGGKYKDVRYFLWACQPINDRLDELELGELINSSNANKAFSAVSGLVFGNGDSKNAKRPRKK